MIDLGSVTSTPTGLFLQPSTNSLNGEGTPSQEKPKSTSKDLEGKRLIKSRPFLRL